MDACKKERRLTSATRNDTPVFRILATVLNTVPDGSAEQKTVPGSETFTLTVKLVEPGSTCKGWLKTG